MNVRRLALIGVVSLLSGAANLVTTGGTAHGQPTPGACGYYTNSYGHEVPRPCGNWRVDSASSPDGATALCRDGTYSYSEHPYLGGTCSHHGGVVQHLR
jgi:hypothetical protein